MGLCLRRVLLQYPMSGWQVSTRISGSFQSESVATFNWNRWQVSTGISGNLRPEYAHVPRLVTWAERWRQLSPAGGATAGSPLATGRACRDAFPGCQALIKHFRADAGPLWACQTRRKTPGLSHHTLAPGAPLLDAIPSQAVRRALTGSLQ